MTSIPCKIYKKYYSLQNFAHDNEALYMCVDTIILMKGADGAAFYSKVGFPYFGCHR